MVVLKNSCFTLLTSAILLLVLIQKVHHAQGQPSYPRGMGSHSQMKNAHHHNKGHHSHHKVKVPDSENPSPDGLMKPKKFTKDKDLIRDREHIKEELAGFIQEKDVAQMSSHELEFHYFKLHDTDNNNKLDGLEMLAALLHVHGDDDDEDDDDVDEEAKIAEFKASPGDTPEMKEEKRKKSGEFYRKKAEKRRKDMEAFRYYTKMIDEVLEEDDYNHDGFLNYVEFAASRRRDDSDEKKENEYSWFDF